MKHLRSFSLLEKEEIFTAEQKDFLSEFAGKRWKYNPSTGLVDVKGNLKISRKDKDSNEIKISNFSGLKFGKVELDFECSRNFFTSLEGSPQIVGRDVNVSFNPLGNLKGGPKEVGDSYNCAICQLTSLEGAPLKIHGNFQCTQNEITSLKGSPEWIGGNFVLYGNDSLVSLEGAPKYVGGIFICDPFRIENGNWGINGWLDVLEGKGVYAGNEEKARKLILTILDADSINEEIQKNPEKIIFRLKDLWNSPEFSHIKKDVVIPDLYKEELETLSDLSDLGF